MKETDIIRDYYDQDPLKEWNRLEGFHFEFEITKIQLKKHLNPGTILDIGGGTGRYSLYLASQGFQSTLVDLSSGNVSFAKNKAKELSCEIKCYQADARDLSALPLEKYDNVLLMGPLYHLSRFEDRKQCVEEAKKHLKPGGKLFASFISSTGGINYYLSECPYEMINESEQSLFDAMENDQTWSGPAFTQATFIENDEIIPFFERLGFETITVFGQEGITATRQKDLEAADQKVRDYYIEISLKLCEKQKYFAYSSHIMYIGTVK